MLSALLFVKAGNVWASLPKSAALTPAGRANRYCHGDHRSNGRVLHGSNQHLSMTTPSPETRTMVSMKPIDIGIPKAVRAIMVRARTRKIHPVQSKDPETL